VVLAIRLCLACWAVTLLGTASTVAGAPRSLTLVALGDSIPYAQDCGGCTGYVERYARAASRALHVPVRVDNRAEHNNLGSTQLLAQVRHSSSMRAALRRADIVTVTIGHNDTPWASSIDPCDGSYSDTVDDDKLDWSKYTGSCLAPIAAKLQANVSRILAEIKRLRGGKPTVIRVTNFHNDHINDPTDLPETYKPSKTVIEALNKAICTAASRAKLPCVDVYHAFNGPSGTGYAGRYMASDGTHPNQRGHALIAKLIEKLRYAPLKSARSARPPGRSAMSSVTTVTR
jgi:lysophospholipase L1-like esterase